MKACAELSEKIRRIAAHMLEAAPEDMVVQDGEAWVTGVPARRVSFSEIGRAAYIRAIDLPEGESPGLEAIGVFDPPQMAWPYGVNCTAVEVDPETGEVRFLDYGYVHDVGTVLNPMIVEGQIQGGVAQGIAGALFEELRYDDDGQPLFGSFMDYMLPTSAEVPKMRIDHQVTPSPLIPGGTKGVGEAGAIGSPAAVVAAIEDALSPFGVRINQTPVTPKAIVDQVRAAREARATAGSPA
jgi:carbon-monoxide dehydrogenase large subunit